MSRLQPTFARLRGEQRLAVIAYFTVGYPRLELTPTLVETAAAAGADAIELGIPFSDPLADGRTIQAASQLALKNGVTVDQLKAVIASPGGPPPGPPPFDDVGGLGAQNANGKGYIQTNLPAGSYAFLCFVPDATTGKPHAALGMVRALTVK